MSDMIVLDRLTKRFGNLFAVDGISLRVAKGEVLGFLGPNGAGKSTTMRLITGFLVPDSGTVSVCDLDVVEYPKETKQRIGYLPEGAPVYGDMTPLGFLNFLADVRGVRGRTRRQRVETVIAETGLESVVRRPIEQLSKGFKRRVGLAQAMLHDPEVLILDEPTDGLDPNQKHHIRELIRTMAAEKAIIVSTHILEEVGAVCDRAVIIAKGRLVADGTAEDLRARLPYHNAIAITIPAERGETVTRALSGLHGIAGVEELNRTPSLITLRAMPDPEAPAASLATNAAEVAELLRSLGVPAHKLTVEEGRLEEVFRQITEPQPATTG